MLGATGLGPGPLWVRRRTAQHPARADDGEEVTGVPSKLERGHQGTPRTGAPAAVQMTSGGAAELWGFVRHAADERPRNSLAIRPPPAARSRRYRRRGGCRQIRVAGVAHCLLARPCGSGWRRVMPNAAEEGDQAEPLEGGDVAETLVSGQYAGQRRGDHDGRGDRLGGLATATSRVAG